MAGKVIFCNCSYSDVIDDGVKADVLSALNERGISFCGVSDLCKLAAEGDARLAEWSRADGLTVVACFDRVVRWLFDRADAELGGDVKILEMRSSSAQDIIAGIDSADKGESDIQIERDGDWVPWFPVIDYDRCVNCRQCLNFCLFGVYAADDDGVVRVVKPANCKNGCPACARVCPECAIIFPKYKDSPINGDEVRDEYMASRKFDVEDLKKLDIRMALRSRGKRFATSSADGEDISSAQKAKRLSMLKESLDIPDEVIANLTKEGGGGCPNSVFCDKQCDEAKGDG